MTHFLDRLGKELSSDNPSPKPKPKEKVTLKLKKDVVVKPVLVKDEISQAALDFRKRVASASVSIIETAPTVTAVTAQLDVVKDKIRYAYKNNLLEDAGLVKELVAEHQKLLDLVIDETLREKK